MYFFMEKFGSCYIFIYLCTNKKKGDVALKKSELEKLLKANGCRFLNTAEGTTFGRTKRDR